MEPPNDSFFMTHIQFKQFHSPLLSDMGLLETILAPIENYIAHTRYKPILI